MFWKGDLGVEGPTVGRGTGKAMIVAIKWVRGASQLTSRVTLATIIKQVLKVPQTETETGEIGQETTKHQQLWFRMEAEPVLQDSQSDGSNVSSC